MKFRDWVGFVDSWIYVKAETMIYNSSLIVGKAIKIWNNSSYRRQHKNPYGKFCVSCFYISWDHRVHTDKKTAKHNFMHFLRSVALPASVTHIFTKKSFQFEGYFLEFEDISLIWYLTGTSFSSHLHVLPSANSFLGLLSLTSPRFKTHLAKTQLLNYPQTTRRTFPVNCCNHSSDPLEMPPLHPSCTPLAMGDLVIFTLCSDILRAINYF